MSACKCPESKKPVEERAWVVLQRKCNHSAFNGHRYTPSNRSAILCPACRHAWRTSAAYVDKLKDAPR